jgi:hypothetical protein
MKASAEKTEQLTKKIQDFLQRNVAPCRNSHGQAFRLQQGFLLSSTQHMVDRLVVQTQDTIKAIAAESFNANDDINYATGLIQDADNSKQLLPRLHEVLQRRDENNPVEAKLTETANQVHKVVSAYLQVGFTLFYSILLSSFYFSITITPETSNLRAQKCIACKLNYAFLSSGIDTEIVSN